MCIGYSTFKNHKRRPIFFLKSFCNVNKNNAMGKKRKRDIGDSSVFKPKREHAYCTGKVFHGVHVGWDIQTTVQCLSKTYRVNGEAESKDSSPREKEE